MYKLRHNMKGFTLTEVMIGIMILTVAIVSATSLLVGLISTNQNNLTTLQAYYLAQEGLEAVRNIRDTNWLHNLGWMGKDSQQLWGNKFDFGKEYVVNLQPNFQVCGELDGLNGISSCKPWSIDDVALPDSGEILKYGNQNDLDVYLSSALGVSDKTETVFRRVVSIKPYDCIAEELCVSEEEKEDFALVESKVIWNLGAKERELTLYEVLTNWKNGAL